MVRQAYTLREDDDDFGQAGTLVREVWNDEHREAFVKTVAGHLLGGVEGDVLERAFEYWKNVDADTGKKIEELVRQGADVGAPGAQPGEAERATRSSSRAPMRASRMQTGLRTLIKLRRLDPSQRGEDRRARPWQDHAMAEPDVSDDVLGAPYTAETLQLRPDDEGEVVATLVHRPAEASRPDRARRCCTSTGSADYFFQTGRPTSGSRRGYDFYALDLRKYGRSLRPHQTAELRRRPAHLLRGARPRPRAGRRGRTTTSCFSAHSTGGLTVPLWLHDRGLPAAGVFLNAPWIDMHGDAFTRLLAHAGHPPDRRVLRPMREIPRKVSGVYARSLHRDHLGEWDFDLAWKPLASWPVYAGWIRAVRTRPGARSPWPRDRRPGADGQLRRGRATRARRRPRPDVAPTWCSTSSGCAGAPHSSPGTSPSRRSRARCTT